MKRNAIQKALTIEVNTAVDAVIAKLELDPKDHNNARRIYRALVGIAAERLLAIGAPPPLVGMEAVRAVQDTVEEKANLAQAEGNPFGLPPTANA